MCGRQYQFVNKGASKTLPETAFIACFLIQIFNRNINTKKNDFELYIMKDIAMIALHWYGVYQLHYTPTYAALSVKTS